MVQTKNGLFLNNLNFLIMPVDPLTASALIAGGSALLGGGANAIAQGNLNRRNRRFAVNMYERQLRDQRANWDLQNAYNSPEAQMQRYRDAGLNPALMYGQGNSGNASPIQGADVQNPQTRSPEWGNMISAPATAYLSTMYDLDMKAAQTSNVRAQNTVILLEALLKARDVEKRGLDIERGRFDLQFDRELRDVSADAKREALRQLQAQVQMTLDENERRALQVSTSVQEAGERMANLRENRLNMRIQRTKDQAEIGRLTAERDRIRQSIALMQKDGVLKDLDIELRRQGINPQDPMWARIVGRHLSDWLAPGGSSPSGGIFDWLFGN